MITYEKIEEANKKTITIDVKGKDYAPVNQRIKAFRMAHPNGSIQTDIVSLENGVVIMQAKCYSDDGALIGTGFAQEVQNSSYINKTSYIENCETSAVGRALGMCGFGIDTSVASAEEVQNAQLQQAESSKVTEREVNELFAYCSDDQIDALLKAKGVTTVFDLPKDYAKKAISRAKAVNTRQTKKEGTQFSDLQKEEETF